MVPHFLSFVIRVSHSAKKKAAPLAERGWSQAADSLAITANGFHRAPCHSFVAELRFVVVLRLFENVAVAAVIRACEVRGRCLTAQVTVDALVVHVEFAGYVLRILVCSVCHEGRLVWSESVRGRAQGANA